jgi:hypothetical protein
VGLGDQDLEQQSRECTTSDSSRSSSNSSSIRKLFAPLEEEKKTEAHEASVDLIRRDVGRSVVFRYNNNNSNNTGDGPVTPSYASERLGQVLEDTIQAGIGQGQGLHYYQGLHDVAGVILHNLDYQAISATSILQRLGQSHLRDALRENFGNITWLLSVLLLPLVESIEPNVHYMLQITEVELSNVCLPWIITWFTHDIYNPQTAGRLVDAFVAGHPLLPLYVSVALLTHPILKQRMLANTDIDFSDDPASMFVLVKQLPKLIVADFSEEAMPEEQGGPGVPVQELLDDALTIL